MKVPIHVSVLLHSNILYLYTIKDEINKEPSYQRQSDVWTLSKKQLLIDSIINGLDIPKLYFHDLESESSTNTSQYTYSIIDGKQRLEAIWDYIEGKYKLSDDIVYFSDMNVNLANLTYAELAQRFPRIKQKFDAAGLTVMVVSVTDIEYIEEMFSRLNEAVPLTAAEKRNSLGGPLPTAIKEVANHPFFKHKLPFSNTRYRHFDLACKLLLLHERSSIKDTKKKHLDDLTRQWKKRFIKDSKEAESSLAQQEANVVSILDTMSKVFIDKDNLLKSVGMVVVYFCLFRDIDANNISRLKLELFDHLRKLNRSRTEQDEEAPISYALLEFDRLVQSPNDASAIKFKHHVLATYLSINENASLETMIELLD